ncbi:hypothetical protein B9G39_03945 [Zooshikella ganghwensis]|uniref:Uncharacterized protein n=1 Tax=Zooshikella ganghwensis TaxID=202772 RepID=A0A4P9VHS1_9GAMM|nr:hypothetical protein B9G39_03945 [Zooshikella ganghwensis]
MGVSKKEDSQDLTTRKKRTYMDARPMSTAFLLNYFIFITPDIQHAGTEMKNGKRHISGFYHGSHYCRALMRFKKPLSPMHPTGLDDRCPHSGSDKGKPFFYFISAAILPSWVSKMVMQ